MIGFEEFGETVGNLMGGGMLGVFGWSVGGDLGRAAASDTLDLLMGRLSRQEALSKCYESMALPPHARESDVIKAYRKRARIVHPDRGGSHEAMVELNFCKELILIAHRSHSRQQDL